MFGVNDKTRTVVGTNYRPDPVWLDSIKMQVVRDTTPPMTFKDVHEVEHMNGRVVMFEIPAAPAGMPVAWKGHYYARAGESLVNLGLDKQDSIRRQTTDGDWSAQIVPDALIDHLDMHAVQKARDSFAQKYANRFADDEVSNWPLQTFLDRARVSRDGKLTRAALLLLGKAESAHLLLPHPAQMTWKLVGPEKAYEHFGPPFLLNSSVLYQRVRNVQLRILPENELLAVEMSKYERKVVLEALHNCIAHQDYSRSGRVVVTEEPDKLIFENEGEFYHGKPDDYVSGNKTPRRYRNAFLAQAMTELNMIDTMGYGIHEMHLSQARRYFPMPDYDLSTTTAVRMTVYGSIVDLAYTRLLMQRTNLPLSDVLGLDRIQKRLPLGDEAIARLRRAGLIEGRKNNLHVSANVAKATNSKAEYIRTRAQDDEHYVKLITDYIEKFDLASRKEIDELLWDKLSDSLDDPQKTNKINNLMTKLRRAGRIENSGSRKSPSWKLAE